MDLSCDARKRKATTEENQHDERAFKAFRVQATAIPDAEVSEAQVQGQPCAGDDRFACIHASGLHVEPAANEADEQQCSTWSDAFMASLKNSRLLPSQQIPGKKGTLVLDMDKTLIYKEWRLQRADQRPQVVVNPDFMFNIVYRGYIVDYHVKKRPYLQEFLQKAAELFEVVLFTASEAIVTLPVIDQLDPSRHLIHHVLCRDACTEVGVGSFVKDLSRLGRDLSKVVIVDDNPDSFLWHQDNAILIGEFGGREDDDMELSLLIPVLEKLSVAEDMRTVVAQLDWSMMGYDIIDQNGCVLEEDLCPQPSEGSQEDSEDSTFVL